MAFTTFQRHHNINLTYCYYSAIYSFWIVLTKWAGVGSVNGVKAKEQFQALIRSFPRRE